MTKEAKIYAEEVNEVKKIMKKDETHKQNTRSASMSFQADIYAKMKEVAQGQDLSVSDFIKKSMIELLNEKYGSDFDPHKCSKIAAGKKSIDEAIMKDLMDENHLTRLTELANKKHQSPKVCLHQLIDAGITDKTIYMSSGVNVTDSIHMLKEFCKDCMYIMAQNNRRTKQMIDDIENLELAKKNPYYEKNVIGAFKAHHEQATKELDKIRQCINRFFKKNFSGR